MAIKYSVDGRKMYKTTSTRNYRVSGNLRNLGGGFCIDSTMLEIPKGTEVVITKTGVNEFHPDICEAYIPELKLQISAIRMIRDLDDEF